MPALLPPAFLFRYEFPVRRIDGVKVAADLASALTDDDALPSPRALNGERDFASLRIAWNNGGLGIALEVAGKTTPLACDPANPTETDGLQVWIDTRNTQSIHRAGRFCHHFAFLPAGAGRGKRKPVAVQLPIARAREDAPLVDGDAFDLNVETRDDGYSLRVFLPAEAMTGFDPEASSRLGFYYAVRDAELGLQTLSVGEEFPYSHDPSLWSTLELVE